MKSKKFFCVLITIILMSTNLAQASLDDYEEPFFSFTILVSPGDTFTYGLDVARYLKDLNIQTKIKVMNYDCNNPNCYPKISKGWDLAICSFEGKRIPDMRDIFTENGSLNICNLNSKIPYQNESEYMQKKGTYTIDLDERQQLYYDWQQLMMKNIIPCLPLFTGRTYTAIWSNTKNYDMRWGLSDMLPYMSCDGIHEGQETIQEFNLALEYFKQRYTFPIIDDRNEIQWELITEPIIQLSPDSISLKTGLVEDWEEVEDSHFKFYLRDNIFWNPSFNISGRTDESTALFTEISENHWEVSDPSILVPGLKYDEISNGISQQVTAKDAVFTILLTANPLFSENSLDYQWISDCYVDPIDPLVFHLHIDDNPETSEIEFNVNFFSYLHIGILPEFFLNSTDDTITQTSGGVNCVGLNSNITNSLHWQFFETSAFGCGKMVLDYQIDDHQTTFTRNPFWFGVGVIDGATGLEPFVENIIQFNIPDEEERIMIFKKGKLDLICVDYFPQERTMQAEPRYEVQNIIKNILNIIAFNLESENIGGSDHNILIEGPDGMNYTQSCAIRKAICYAIDREEMDQKNHDGEYTLCHSPMYFYASFYYYDDVIKYYRNITIAKEWMEAAGFRFKSENDETYFNTIFTIICIILFSKLVYKKKFRKEKKKSY